MNLRCTGNDRFQWAYFCLIGWIVVFILLPLPASDAGPILIARWLTSLDVDKLPPENVYICAVSVSLSVLAFYKQYYKERPIDIPSVSAIAVTSLSFVGAASHAALFLALLWSVFWLAATLGSNLRTLMFNLVAVMLALQMVASFLTYLGTAHQFTTPGFGRRASGFLGTPDAIYPLSIFSLFIFLFWAVTSKVRISHLPCMCLAILSGLIVILTFSRSAWLGCAGGFLMLATSWKSKSRFVVTALAITLIGGAVTVRTHGEVLSSTNDQSAVGRVRIWEDAFHLSLRHPFFGFGYGAYGRLKSVTFDEQFLHMKFFPAEPKNLMLDLLLDHGIVGLSLYVVLVISCFKMCIYVARSSDMPTLDTKLAKVMPIMLLSVLVAGLFDTPILGTVVRTPGTLVLLVLVGLLFGAYKDAKLNSTSTAQTVSV